VGSPALLAHIETGYFLVVNQDHVAAAASGGVVCMTGFCHRFHPPILAIKEQLDAGSIGAPVSFRSRFASRFAGVEQTWFADPAVSGGGSVMDSSVHSLDLYRFLIGEITRVTAYLTTHLPGLVVEDTSVLLVNGPDGVPGTIEASWVTPAGGSMLTIFGTEGTLAVDYGAGDFGVAYLQRAGEAAPHELPLQGPNRFTAEVRHFLACIAAGRRPTPSIQDGLRAVQVIMAAYAAPAGVGAAIDV
jgi:predicted dehydrogenase